VLEEQKEGKKREEPYMKNMRKSSLMAILKKRQRDSIDHIGNKMKMLIVSMFVLVFVLVHNKRRDDGLLFRIGDSFPLLERKR
jgi:hypothetical protein